MQSTCPANIIHSALNHQEEACCYEWEVQGSTGQGRKAFFFLSRAPQSPWDKRSLVTKQQTMMHVGRL